MPALLQLTLHCLCSCTSLTSTLLPLSDSMRLGRGTAGSWRPASSSIQHNTVHKSMEVTPGQAPRPRPSCHELPCALLSGVSKLCVLHRPAQTTALGRSPLQLMPCCAALHTSTIPYLATIPSRPFQHVTVTQLQKCTWLSIWKLTPVPARTCAQQPLPCTPY
jgi:hypothetical protein